MADDEGLGLIDESGQPSAEIVEALAKALEKLSRQQDGATKSGENLATSLTNLTSQAKTFEGVGMNLITNTGEMAKGFLSVVNPLNILGNAVNQVIDQTGALLKAQDKAMAEFNKATGATKLYGEEIENLRFEMFMHGVDMEKAGETYEALTQNVTDLRHMSAQSRAELAQTTAILDQLGVEASITSQSFQFLTKSMGLSASEASAFSREMFVLAQSIGMPPAEMAQAFNAARGDLAVFGDEAGEVFMDIQVNARAAGMEVDQLLGITKKFDTFEGAAESVGRLNAILGGPFLNSMQMVQTTDPTERMRLLSDAISSAGLSFEDMSYYQRIALAEAAGFKDVEELALVMKGGFDDTSNSINSTDASLQSLQEAQKNFVDLQTRMSQTLGYFAIGVGPIIKLLSLMLDGINFVLGGINELGSWAIPTLTLVLGVWAFKGISVVGVLGSMWSMITGLGGSILALVPKATALAGSITGIGAAAATATPTLPALGTATAASGNVAGAGATGFLAAGAAIALMGAGALMAGAGVFLVGKGLSLIFSALLSEGLDGIMALNQLGASMAMLTIASLGLGFALPSLANLVAVINSLEENKVIPFASLFDSINSILDKDIQNLITMEQSIGRIVQSINSIDDTNKIMEVRKLIQQVNTAAAGTQATATTATAKLPTDAATSQPLNINLKINNREMGSWTYKTVADFLNMGRSN